jgi:diaminopropionate ammonia-lyase
MQILENPYRSAAATIELPDGVPFPSADMAAARSLLTRCPEAGVTPLRKVEGLARVSQVHVKDERDRMGLGSFKALGAAYVIARDAAAKEAEGRTYVTASAGNHGLSVAAGAKVFGAHAVIYIANSVPGSFAERLQNLGAEVRRKGETYEASMDAAAAAAEKHGWHLLSDSSWEGYTEPPFRVMEGYLALMDEVFDQMSVPATHVFLQAGVGGFAGACAAAIRAVWGEDPIIVVVEPSAAPALMGSIQAGRVVKADGPVSNMGRLDCKEPSLIALKGLARDADWFCTLTDAEARKLTGALSRFELATSPSGGAGLAALMADDRAFGLTPNARVLCVLSEGA